ncbi:hypothetical protein JCM19037_2366 [Geomicrobium sp. JCM 19037]|uniref:class I SAM-dependent methyltransferase n=1 Tax=Geomicrobium sp. JCM 19037 TaxID=1460634 RepID=UPI00045F38CB|nr:class I SAM-dependent methyltransferase [Geomicrobium sp. JCM 19037]GAK03996.1 hypothetical protein JCM19037_2366 [Geomicrobium sp. JCM 19037]
MNKLHKYFESNDGRLIHKWIHYFDIYERHFDRFVGTDVNILEVGVSHGGSLQMWKEYFGKGATIYGLDINPVCKSFEEEQVNIIIGDQGNRTFWQSIKPTLPEMDIIIDDGGHFMHQQIITFEEMYPLLSANGVFLIEDLHTSYMEEYGGGYENPNNFIEYSKPFIDQLHAWYSRDSRLAVTDFSRSAWSMSYYDSILVIEKRPKQPPYDKMTGKPSW